MGSNSVVFTIDIVIRILAGHANRKPGGAAKNSTQPSLIINDVNLMVVLTLLFIYLFFLLDNTSGKLLKLFFV